VSPTSRTKHFGLVEYQKIIVGANYQLSKYKTHRRWTGSRWQSKATDDLKPLTLCFIKLMQYVNHPERDNKLNRRPSPRPYILKARYMYLGLENPWTVYWMPWKRFVILLFTSLWYGGSVEPLSTQCLKRCGINLNGLNYILDVTSNISITPNCVPSPSESRFGVIYFTLVKHNCLLTETKL